MPKLLKSIDHGVSWSVAATFTGTGLTGTNTTNGMSNGQGYFDLAIMASPANADHVIVGTTSMYKSTDGGANFSPLGGYVGPFYLHPDVQWMAASGSDSYIATDGGVNHSSDFYTSTSNFTPRLTGLTASDNWGFGQGWSEDILVAGRYHNGNAALYDLYGGGNSLSIGGGEDATGHVFQIPGKTAVTGFRDLGSTLFHLPATVSGSVTNASYANTLWPSDYWYGEFSSELVQHPRYSNVFFVGNSKSLWKSTNYGLSYQELKNFGANVYRFEVCRSNPDYIYLCNATGIFRTIN